MAQTVAPLVRTFIKYGAIVWLGSYAIEGVKVLAGQTTVVDVVLAVFGRNGSAIFAGSMGAFGTGSFLWALSERRLRQRKVNGMQDRLRGLEKHLDPNRTSSGLTAEGQSPPEDV